MSSLGHGCDLTLSLHSELVHLIRLVVVDHIHVLPISCKSVVIDLYVLCTALLVPELVEEGVILLLLKGFHHSVQVAFTQATGCFLLIVPHFDVNDLLSGLHSPSKL